MQPIDKALQEVGELHQQLLQTPAPEIEPHSFIPFPPGIDPIAYAIEEVAELQRVVEATRKSPECVSQPGWVPNASVYSSESTVLYQIEIPGTAREDLTVSVAAGELIVRGQRNSGVDPELHPVSVEQGWGPFERRFSLPAWAGPDTINARYERGMLEVRLSRADIGSSSEFQVEIG